MNYPHLAIWVFRIVSDISLAQNHEHPLFWFGHRRLMFFTRRLKPRTGLMLPWKFWSKKTVSWLQIHLAIVSITLVVFNFSGVTLKCFLYTPSKRYTRLDTPSCGGSLKFHGTLYISNFQWTILVALPSWSAGYKLNIFWTYWDTEYKLSVN